MGLIRSCVGIWSAAHKPTLKNQQVGIATAPTASISTAMAFGFVEAGHQNVLTLSPCLEGTPAGAPGHGCREAREAHPRGCRCIACIKPFGLEIKVIQRNHLDRRGEVPVQQLQSTAPGWFSRNLAKALNPSSRRCPLPLLSPGSEAADQQTTANPVSPEDASDRWRPDDTRELRCSARPTLHRSPNSRCCKQPAADRLLGMKSLSPQDPTLNASRTTA